MKVLLAIEEGGHVYWQRNNYTFIMVDTISGRAEYVRIGDILTKHEPMYGKAGLEVEYYFTQNGVEAQLFNCGSGFGKVPSGKSFVIIPNEMYDSLVILENKQKRAQEKQYQGNL